MLDHVVVDHRSSPEAKIALFRSLFRGRHDVYWRRFESRTSGKSGYSPACEHEWVKGICEKPRVKCASCQHRQFLPIPFDGWGIMEVDLFCADARLVIELDGGQHLENADAYRRDRRKDALLQENGYFVLRFLAEDVGTRLDMVLDAVLRTLSHLGSPVT